MAVLWTSRNYSKNDRIYRGCYNYYRNDNLYAEENFDVYKDKRDQTLHFISESVMRVSTGEMLNIHTEYITNKEFVPLFVYIEKIMGKEIAKEVYDFSPKRSVITYTFKNTKGDEHVDEIMSPPKFHITTPTALTSMLFIRTKKFDATGKNTYSLVVSDNTWEYTAAPRFTNPIVERVGLSNEKVTIDGQNVLASPFRLFDEVTEFKSVKEPPHVKIYLSPHNGIAYTIRSEEGTKIQIRYLNDLTEKE